VKIRVRLYGAAQKYRPPDAPESGPFVLELPEGATVAAAAERLGLPPAWTRASFINGEAVPLERPLPPDELLVFAPPMGGGASYHGLLEVG